MVVCRLLQALERSMISAAQSLASSSLAPRLSMMCSLVRGFAVLMVSPIALARFLQTSAHASRSEASIRAANSSSIRPVGGIIAITVSLPHTSRHVSTAVVLFMSLSFLRCRQRSNPTVDLAPFGRWTSRDKAARGRSPTRWASPLLRPSPTASRRLRQALRAAPPSPPNTPWQSPGRAQQCSACCQSGRPA